MSNDISTYLAGIKTALQAAYAGVVDTVDYHLSTAQDRTINTPAILIGVNQIDEGVDGGDERTPVVMQVSLFCVLSGETQDADVEVMNFAASVLTQTRNNRWGLTGLGKPERISAQEALFSPTKEGLPCWEVRFEQAVDFGSSVWAPDPDFVTPVEVMLGRAPLIGTGNEEHYRRVYPADPTVVVEDPTPDPEE